MKGGCCGPPKLYKHAMQVMFRNVSGVFTTTGLVWRAGVHGQASGFVSAQNVLCT